MVLPQFFPTQNFELWSVWQNENYNVAAEPQTSQQGATLKSCSNNIKADMAPLLLIYPLWTKA